MTGEFNIIGVIVGLAAAGWGVWSCFAKHEGGMGAGEFLAVVAGLGLCIRSGL